MPPSAGMKEGGQALLGGLDCMVQRNFFGAQVGAPPLLLPRCCRRCLKASLRECHAQPALSAALIDAVYRCCFSVVCIATPASRRSTALRRSWRRRRACHARRMPATASVLCSSGRPPSLRLAQVRLAAAGCCWPLLLATAAGCWPRSRAGLLAQHPCKLVGCVASCPSCSRPRFVYL